MCESASTPGLTEHNMEVLSSEQPPHHIDMEREITHMNNREDKPQQDGDQVEDIARQNGIGSWYSRQLVKLPVAIGMCIGLLILTAVCGIVSLLVYDPPDFSEPTKGFEARGTEVNARMLSFYNLIYKDSTLSSSYIINRNVTPVVGETSPNNAPNVETGRVRRDAVPWSNMSGEGTRDNTGHEASSTVQFCPYWGLDAKFYPSAVVFEAVGNDRLFSRKALISICTQYDDHIGNTHEMQISCCMKLDGLNCSDSWSLGNYVALLNDRESCQDILDADVVSVQTLLEKCAPYYQRKSLKYCREDSSKCPRDVPPECLDFDHAVYSIFQYLVPSKFVENANSGNFNLSSTILFLPNIGNNREIYEAAFQGKDINDGVTSVVALGFGSLKFELFSDFLLSDTLYIGLGAGLVFIIIWVYTGSLFITIMTIVSMLMSLVVAYFAFAVIFGLPFFPFVNIASAVLIIGIGADDTFVYVDIWSQTKSAHPTAHRSLILRETLKHAAVTMFVTSFTTASALYSSIVSSITAVRCFGVYGGTAIIVNFIFTLTWLPAVVVIHSRCQDWCTTLNNPFPDCLTKLHTCYSVVAGAYRSFFEQYLPVVVIKLRYAWIVILASLGVGAFCVVYITPKLRLPTTAEFQVFRDSDLFELYDNVYKSMFYFNIEGNDPLFISAVFGVNAVDNGNHWDPGDEGTLVLLNNFNMFHPDAQEWLLEFCHEFRNQSFYGHGSQIDRCYMDSFISMMETDCNAAMGSFSPCCGQTSFPYPADLFEMCVKASRTCDMAISSCTRYIFPGPVFSTVDGSVKAFFMKGSSSRMDTMDYNYNNEFWTEANTWLDDRLKTKPAAIKGGWLYAGSVSYSGQQLYFYNLQRSLAADTPISMGLSLAIAALVLLLTTWNLLISLYAMLSIAGAFCVTVGTLVLLDWRLNIFESAILSLAVGLSVDFTIHYGVAYRLAMSNTRTERTLHSLTTVGSAITVAALSTFAAGAMMMPSTVITYVQLGTFLMLVMTVSWVYATFFFLSVCRVIGPQGRCAQIPFPGCCFPSSGERVCTIKKRSTSPTRHNAVMPDEPVSGVNNVKMLHYKSTEVVDNICVAEGVREDNTPALDSIRADEINQTNPAEMDAGLR